ncbi:glycosidase [Chitinivorax tropicus]|uniref:Glycosidase n=1 Tax=Chitinivorax tropicus TaxID=714531 RepID=A0A840MJP1_9PROT|nr:glycoside hydrolase family 13 protein [Chitinivorax tropicus]MBB5019414.1 glycosidase [Chitinivorax tropicus]
MSVTPSRQIVYQIFPERFAIGRGLTGKEKLSQAAYQRPGNILKADWQARPAEDDAELKQCGQVFYGGDLQGITERLDYIQESGFNTLYFTPIFDAPSNHKYDAMDFFRIDPMFGDEAALKRLIAELDKRGMGLILDAVLNHVNYQHPWFLAAKRGEQPYRDFFTFDKAGNHLCWWGHPYLAELNLDNPELQSILFAGERNFLSHYLEMGITGWRFDTAQDLGMKTAERIRQSIHRRFPHAQLLGELMSYAGGWVNGRGYTGMMNYYFREAMLAWLAGDIAHQQANAAMREYYDGYGHEGSLNSWLMLGSHDTMRLRTAIPDVRLRQLAVAAQFTLPGIPLVYYGDENGMEGGNDPDCRRPMVWDEAQWERPMRDFIQTLVGIREANAALQNGKLMMLGEKQTGNALIYLRYTDVPGQLALVVLNLGDAPLRELVFIPYPHLYNSVPLRNQLAPGNEIKMGGGCIWVEAPPKGVAIYTPFEPHAHFRFYKERNLVV